MALTGGEMGSEAEMQQRESILLELKKFDFKGRLFRNMKDCERAVLTFQNVSGETASSAMKVGIWTDSETASLRLTS